jgi:hypothetical protein
MSAVLHRHASPLLGLLSKGMHCTGYQQQAFAGHGLILVMCDHSKLLLVLKQNGLTHGCLVCASASAVVHGSKRLEGVGFSTCPCEACSGWLFIYHGIWAGHLSSGPGPQHCTKDDVLHGPVAMLLRCVTQWP